MFKWTFEKYEIILGFFLYLRGKGEIESVITLDLANIGFLC